MRSFVLSVAAYCITTAACVAGPSARAPVAPAPAEAGAYYPLVPGWKWAYEIRRNGEAILGTYAVIDRKQNLAIMQAGDDRISYDVRPDGIARLEPLSPDEYVLKTPVVLGASWSVESGTARVSAAGATVDLPAGRFINCATVEVQRTHPDRTARTTYAAGIGPIQIEFKAQTPLGYEVVKATLIGFTRPGEDPLAVRPRPSSGSTTTTETHQITTVSLQSEPHHRPL